MWEKDRYEYLHICDGLPLIFFQGSSFLRESLLLGGLYFCPWWALSLWVLVPYKGLGLGPLDQFNYFIPINSNNQNIHWPVELRTLWPTAAMRVLVLHVLSQWSQCLNFINAASKKNLTGSDVQWIIFIMYFAYIKIVVFLFFYCLLFRVLCLTFLCGATIVSAGTVFFSITRKTCPK